MINALKIPRDSWYTCSYPATTATLGPPDYEIGPPCVVTCENCMTEFSRGLGDKLTADTDGELYTAARMAGWYITANAQTVLCEHCAEHLRQELNYYKKLRDGLNDN